ncbi:MAG: hypothetical protein JO187_00730 [Acidobacteria bacterium]|nr:hypothetical protein [Acidobacteriaceae bacterium]MBV9608054.1 hypothetical protein [Acidobacteriota bacterium]
MNTRFKNLSWLAAFAVLVGLGIIIACGGGSGNNGGLNGGANVSGAQGAIANICDCTPSESEADDYRHAEKHVGLPGSTGQQISVSTILSWAQGPDPADDAPRSGRENQEFFIPRAYLQFVWLFAGDCDIHMELSDSPSKSAPRVIVETPIDSEYCSARQTIQQQLADNGVTLSTTGQEISNPLPVQVLGLAFQDKRHKRGTQFVATVWELHPAIVSVTQ